MACAQLSSDAAQEVAMNAKRPCEKAVRDLQVKGTTVQSVRVYGDSATVSFTGGDTAFLSDTKQGWRVDAAGCQPQAPSAPEDCEVQA